MELPTFEANRWALDPTGLQSGHGPDGLKTIGVGAAMTAWRDDLGPVVVMSVIMPMLTAMPEIVSGYGPGGLAARFQVVGRWGSLSWQGNAKIIKSLQDGADKTDRRGGGWPFGSFVSSDPGTFVENDGLERLGGR